MSAPGGHLSALWRSRSGVSAIEFAVILPVLVTMFLGLGEMGRLIYLHQKLQTSVFAIADIISRDKKLTEAKVTSSFSAIRHMITPFEFGEDGVAFLTSISGVADPASGELTTQINWQRSGGGVLDADSAIGDPGEEANVPNGFVIPDGDATIVAEVFYDYRPFLGFEFARQRIHKTFYVSPRLSLLTSIDP